MNCLDNWILTPMFPGGGIATDEESLGLPLNVVDFDSLKPHLSYLINVYGIIFVSTQRLINMLLLGLAT